MGMIFTVKQTRVDPMTCNNETNKTKRQAFAKSFKKHQHEGDCIVYFDEISFNVYCTRGRGRAKKAEQDTVVMLPSKGANLQVQCVVNSGIGVLLYKQEMGSIRMEQNAVFIDDIYRTVKPSIVCRENYNAKMIVVILNNAPAHRQTGQRVKEHDDLVLPLLTDVQPYRGLFFGVKGTH